MSAPLPANHVSEFGPNWYTYGQLKCRCDACMTFVRERRAEAKERREAEAPTVVEVAPPRPVERKASPREQLEQAIASGDSTTTIMRRLGVDYEAVKTARDRLGVTDTGISNQAARRPCPGCGVLPFVEWVDQESTVKYRHLPDCPTQLSPLERLALTMRREHQAEYQQFKQKWDTFRPGRPER